MMRSRWWRWRNVKRGREKRRRVGGGGNIREVREGMRDVERGRGAKNGVGTKWMKVAGEYG